MPDNRYTVLLVDDNPENIRLLDEALCDEYTIKVATRGQRAIDIAQTMPIDIILLDIMMPEMDGQETLKRIRAIEKEGGIMLGHGAKIIMQTAHTDSKNILESFNEMCDAYLVKPIQINKLNDELRTLGLIE